MTFANARARPDPFIGGFHDLFQVGICRHARRQESCHTRNLRRDSLGHVYLLVWNSPRLYAIAAIHDKENRRAIQDGRITIARQGETRGVISNTEENRVLIRERNLWHE